MRGPWLAPGRGKGAPHKEGPMRLLLVLVAAGLLAACAHPYEDYYEPSHPSQTPPPPPPPGPGGAAA